jgi:hypothetical protein
MQAWLPGWDPWSGGFGWQPGSPNMVMKSPFLGVRANPRSWNQPIGLRPTTRFTSFGQRSDAGFTFWIVGRQDNRWLQLRELLDRP